jgi:hypothetical protein
MRTVPRALGPFRDLVESRAQALHDSSFDELQSLESTPPESLIVESRPAEIYTIIEAMPCGRLRVVLQGSMKPRFLPLGRHMAVAGFYKTPDGAVEPLPDSEYHDFA